MSPPAIIWLYELRSNAVHGTNINFVNLKDIWHLRILCSEVLRILISGCLAHPEFQTLRDLVESYETPNALTRFIETCESLFSDVRGIGDIKSYVKSLAKNPDMIHKE